jgi:hypothetical protein
VLQKYTAVQSLVRRNPWSMNLDDPSLAHRFTLQTLDVQRDKSVPLFKFFADYKRKGILPSLFNSVILDPPKKKVMLYIYSKYFLEHLAGTLHSPHSPITTTITITITRWSPLRMGSDGIVLLRLVARCRVDEEGRRGGGLHAAGRALAQVRAVPRGARADVPGHSQV